MQNFRLCHKVIAITHLQIFLSTKLGQWTELDKSILCIISYWYRYTCLSNIIARFSTSQHTQIALTRYTSQTSVDPITRIRNWNASMLIFTSQCLSVKCMCVFGYGHQGCALKQPRYFFSLKPISMSETKWVLNLLNCIGSTMDSNHALHNKHVNVPSLFTYYTKFLLKFRHL